LKGCIEWPGSFSSTLARSDWPAHGPGTTEVDQCRAWLAHIETSTADPVIPAIADYEVRRELIRLRATAKLRRLDALRGRFGCVPFDVGATDQAAEYWALIRRGGMPTAGDEALDADALIAGLAATLDGLSDTVTIATSNVRHFTRFPGITAELWSNIT
jgi:predicted nucleic acid-binding protein